MKRFFIIFAAMLLVSVGAFAQSKTPLKGDVNGDGVVDVGDITAVIGIIKNVQEHYFYLGTIKPTAENYKIIPGATTSYSSFDEAVGTNVSVDAGQTLYMLCPAEWVKGKTVVLEDNLGETLNFSEEIDYITVSGYAIYKTQVLSDAKDVTLKGAQQLYYWYAGANASDSYINASNYTSIASLVTTIPTTTEVTSNNEYLYVVVSKEKVLTVYDENNFEVVMKTYNSSTNTFTHAETYVGDYAIYRSVGIRREVGVDRIVIN